MYLEFPSFCGLGNTSKPGEKEVAVIRVPKIERCIISLCVSQVFLDLLNLLQLFPAWIIRIRFRRVLHGHAYISLPSFFFSGI